MSAHLNLTFRAPTDQVTSNSVNWQPPSFPPPDDWVIVVDAEGEPLSRYGDDVWDFRAFFRMGQSGGQFKFGGQSLSEQNKQLLKQAMVFIMYHHRLFPGTIGSCRFPFLTLLKIARKCEEHGISINQLSRFPKVHDSVVEVFNDSRGDEGIAWLHKLLNVSSQLGFEIADQKTLAFFASQRKDRARLQHPYIPPRIWTYQVNRLNHCVETFLACQDQVERAFNWIADAYENNLSLSSDPRHASPFSSHRYKLGGRRTLYDGNFHDFLEEYGLLEAFNDVLKDQADGKYNIKNFFHYLNVVRNASIGFILSFSLQRRSEVSELRSDCFITEKDEKLGAIGMIVGETTKTEEDSDARWIVPLYVKKAVDASTFIAKLRMRFCPPRVSEEVRENPYLTTPGWEPWSTSKGSRAEEPRFTFSYDFLTQSSSIFDLDSIKITEEDWRVACALTPDLSMRPEFGIGKPWKFTAHQMRRTTSVNIYASDMVSLQSLQWGMKHLSRNMTLYYTRNYTNLSLNSEASRAVILEQYRSIYRQLISVANDSLEHVQPHGRETLPDRVVNLIETHEEKKLINLIKAGQTGCRKTRLGFCMKPGHCEYGGIESIAHCAGYEGKGICVDARFDRKREPELRAMKAAHEKEMTLLDAGSPRFNYLAAEVYAVEVYLNAVKKGEC